MQLYQNEIEFHTHIQRFVFAFQVRFRPETMEQKTMETMNKAAREAMMPDYEMYCADLAEG